MATVEVVNTVISVLGFGGTITTLSIGLGQYRRAEAWKRAEFIASEMRDFLKTPAVSKAMLMIDWGTRQIDLFDVTDSKRDEWPVVDRQMQWQGLLPHPIKNAMQGSDVVQDGKRKGDLLGFSAEQAVIRDCFDSFLDGLERFASFVQTGLIPVEGLRPYLGYWIDDIAAPTKDTLDAAWSCSLLAYIHFYRFTGVQDLFLQFGHDIQPSGELFREFLAQVPDRDIAARLKSLLDAESRMDLVPRA